MKILLPTKPNLPNLIKQSKSRVFQKKVCTSFFEISWLSRGLEKWFEMVRIDISTNLMSRFVFTLLWLPWHLKMWFRIVFSSPSCAEYKNIKINILGLKKANTLSKMLLGIIFVEIERHLTII